MSGPKAVLRLARVTAGAVALLAFQSSAALAQSQTIGGRIKAAMENMVGPMIFLVALCCSLGGLVLIAKGLLKLKDSHQGQGVAGQAFGILVAGALLFALPHASGIGMMSLLGQTSFFSIGISDDVRNIHDALDGSAATSAASNLSNSISRLGGFPPAPQPCFSMGREAVPCMAKNLADNMVPVGVIAVFAFVYLAGFWGLGSALFELARHSGERGGGSPPGFWTKVVACVLMLGAYPFFSSVSQTLLGSQEIIGLSGVSRGSNLLSYNVTAAPVLAEYTKLIGHLFTILVLFGVIAFAKGIFTIKAAAEQRQNASYSHGFVFMAAGTMLANAKLTTCTVMSTLMGATAAGSVGFCS